MVHRPTSTRASLPIVFSWRWASGDDVAPSSARTATRDDPDHPEAMVLLTWPRRPQDARSGRVRQALGRRLRRPRRARRHTLHAALSMVSTLGSVTVVVRCPMVVGCRFLGVPWSVFSFWPCFMGFRIFFFNNFLSFSYYFFNGIPKFIWIWLYWFIKSCQIWKLNIYI